MYYNTKIANGIKEIKITKSEEYQGEKRLPYNVKKWNSSQGINLYNIN